MDSGPKARERVCPWWMSYFLCNPLRLIVHNPERILDGHVRPGHTAMDLGCGPGYFTLPMARLVGQTGQVIAVDLQPRMLDILRRRAERAGLSTRIQLHQCSADRLGVQTQVDFAMAFAMVHEVPDPHALLGEIATLLKPEARFLLAEPRAHITPSAFNRTLEIARTVGLLPCAEPRIAMCRAVLLAPSGG